MFSRFAIKMAVKEENDENRRRTEEDTDASGASVTKYN